MATIIIAKNTTTGYMDVNDLGLTIGPSEVINLTEIFTKNEILESADLKPLVEIGNIIINDGTQDLSASDGLMHVGFETEYEDLFDVPIIESELPVTSISRDTNFPITTTPTPIQYQNLLIQNLDDIIEWASDNPTKIFIKQTGLYLFIAKIEKEISSDVEFTFAVYLNGVKINQSEITSIDHRDYEDSDGIVCVANITESCYAQLYVNGNITNGNLTKANFSVIKLQGAKGDKGDPGEGSSISVMDSMTALSDISLLNFINASISEGAPGRADIAFDLSSIFNEAACCQIRNSANNSLTTSYENIPFNTTDIQNDTSTIIHSSTIPGQINIKKTGLYQIIFNGQFNCTGSNFTRVYCQIIKNNTDVLPSTLVHGNFYTGEIQDLNIISHVYLAENDFINLQAYANATPTTLLSNYNLSVFKCDAIKGDKGEPGIPGGDVLSSIQARRTNTIEPISETNWMDVNFEIIDIESQPIYLYHDPVNNDRMIINASGVYQITYTGNSDSGMIEGRLRINDSTVINGSYQQTRPSVDTDIDILSTNCIVNLSVGDFVTMQIRGESGTNLNSLVLTIIKLNGSIGEKGDPGGSDVDIEMNDSLVSADVTTINFEGAVNVLNEIGKTTVVVGDGSGETANIFQAHNGSSNVDLNTTNNIPVPFTVENIKDTYYVHSNTTNNSRITLIHAGWYKISYNITTDNDNNSRRTIQCFARKNGTTEIIPSSSYAYSRNSTDDRATNTATFFAYFNLNEYIEIVGVRKGSYGNAYTISNECWVSIEFIKE